MDLFRSIVFEHTKLNHRIIDGACDLIAVDRAGEDLDRETFSKAIKMFHEMQVYTKHFEPRMLELSQTYVKAWADAASVEKSLPDYVKSGLALINSEMARVEIFQLDNSTRRDLLTLLEDHIISRKESRLSKFPASPVFTYSNISQQTKTSSPTCSKTTLSMTSVFYILFWTDAN